MSKFDYMSAFNDADCVRELAAAGEPLVQLLFSDELGSLYCHSCLLSLHSPVLRNVLDDTQQEQDRIRAIPLAGDSDVDLWKLLLGRIYCLEDATITLDNAQGLLLLAHKYDMHKITAHVNRFLLGNTVPSVNSRLQGHLSTTIVGEWLTTASRCGLDEVVQICIDYSVGQNLPLYLDLLTGLQPSHANLLLAAKETQANSYKSRLDLLVKKLGSRELAVYTCSHPHFLEYIDADFEACQTSWVSRADSTSCVCKHHVHAEPNSSRLSLSPKP